MSRILWHSVAPWAGSGYGQQTRVFAPRLRDIGHHVAMSAFWGLEGSILAFDGMSVYPGDTKYGSRTLPLYAEREQADLVITLMDVWVLNAKKVKDLPLASWVPIDHDPAPPRVLDFLEESGSRPIAMSRFGERMLTDAGLDPLYVPHGIETDVFKPARNMRASMRASWSVPEDAFIVGMVAANKGRSPARKSFGEVMQAFAQLREDVPDAYLYMHTEVTGREQGVPIARLADQCGVPIEALLFTQPIMFDIGLDARFLPSMYSAFDVLANPSYGEGFGIPIVEAQACGVPVIVTDCTAMTELCGAGWLVSGEPFYSSQESFYTRPSVDGIAAAMFEAYEARDDAALRAKARDFALRYDADRVLDEYWRPALAKLLPSRLEVAA